jgi:hypothetical protein
VQVAHGLEEGVHEATGLDEGEDETGTVQELDRDLRGLGEERARGEGGVGSGEGESLSLAQTAKRERGVYGGSR